MRANIKNIIPHQSKPQGRGSEPYAEANLFKDEEGVTAVEFAFVAPVFLLLISAVIEFSLVMFTTSVMEGATNSTSRLGKTGYTPAGFTRGEAIINAVKDRTASLLDPAKITIDSKVYSDFSKVGKPEPCVNPVNPPCSGTAGVNYVDVNGNGNWDQDMGAAGLGNAGDIVVYTVTYPWAIMSPLMHPMLGSIYNISVRSIVRNEPFSGAGGS